MKPTCPSGRLFALEPWCTLTVVVLFASCIPAASAQEEKGCRGVNFATHPSEQYSPESLQRRLKQNPRDVDALIHRGIRLAEQEKFAQAYAEYEKAIQAKPDCSLGYLFGGMVQEIISGEADSDAQEKIGKAITLDPSLQSDPNVEGFLRRHAPPTRAAPAESTASPSFVEDLLASANHFLIGIGVGMLLAVPFVFIAGRRQRTSV